MTIIDDSNLLHKEKGIHKNKIKKRYIKKRVNCKLILLICKFLIFNFLK